MRKTTIFSAVFSLFLLPASITWAQTISSQKGLTTAVFTTANGNVKVYLPDDIRPGDVISGTVVAEAKGNNERQVEKNLDELSKFTVNINGNKCIVSSKPQSFKWLVQQDRLLIAPIELVNVSGARISQLTVRITKADNNQPVSMGCSVPSHALTDAPLRITGNFDGDATNTKVSLNNQSLEIIAESPRQCLVQFPQNANGVQAMQVKENGKEACTQNISAVGLSASAPRTNLQKGEKTTLSVRVDGLQNLPDTAVLTLANTTTGTVALKPSNNVIIALLPDSVRNGVFTREFDVQSIATGNFIININLDLPEPGNNNQYGIFCDDKCSPAGSETDAQAGEVGISSSASSSPDDEDKAFKTAKWVVNNGDLFGATGNEDAALQALEKIGRTRGYVIWVKPCWKRCEKGFLCNDWKNYCGAWIPVIWVDGLENDGNNTFNATGGHTTTGKEKVEGLTRNELLKLAIKIGNGSIKKK